MRKQRLVVTISCDRCDAVAVDLPAEPEKGKVRVVPNGFYLERFAVGDSRSTDYDLCSTCASSFNEWLRNWKPLRG